MIVTFDTNVLLSATLWEGSVANRLLVRLLEKKIKICCSLEIIEEYCNALVRDFNFLKEDALSFAEDSLEFVEITSPKNKLIVVKDDPADDKVFECALESRSDYILSYDKHLLNVKEYKGIKIIKPEEFLENYLAIFHKV